MLRGGAFNNNERNARCAYRNYNNPDNDNRNNGFRVVVGAGAAAHIFYRERQSAIGAACRKCQTGQPFWPRRKNSASRSWPEFWKGAPGEYRKAPRPGPGRVPSPWRGAVLCGNNNGWFVIQPKQVHAKYACAGLQSGALSIDRCTAFARRYRYALQCDVEQFFPAIDHAILRRTLAHKIADPHVLWLVDCILASGAGVLAEEYRPRTFRGDTLFDLDRPRGLPIGNLTSQFWANVYLNSFDHFVKRELGCLAYLRYVDDSILFGDDKAEMQAWLAAIVTRLARLRLTIHPGAHVRPVTEGLPFLGFVVFPTHRRLKRRKGIAFARRYKQLRRAYRAGEIPLARVTVSVQGWINHVRYGDTWGLRRVVLARR